MSVDWNHELIEQLDFHWNIVRPRLDDLTDDEYLWEPVSGMWSLRRRGEATSNSAMGAGDTVADFSVPEPSPPPVTTIAWRMAHISIGIFGMRAANHFGNGDVSYPSTDWPLTAAGGLALLDRHHRAWMDGVRELGTDDLARPCGPAEGPYADYPMATLILHISREAIHHLAEIMLLRDLYRQRDELGQPSVASALHRDGAPR